MPASDSLPPSRLQVHDKMLGTMVKIAPNEMPNMPIRSDLIVRSGRSV